MKMREIHPIDLRSEWRLDIQSATNVLSRRDQRIIDWIGQALVASPETDEERKEMLLKMVDIMPPPKAAYNNDLKRDSLCVYCVTVLFTSSPT